MVKGHVPDFSRFAEHSSWLHNPCKSQAKQTLQKNCPPPPPSATAASRDRRPRLLKDNCCVEAATEEAAGEEGGRPAAEGARCCRRRRHAFARAPSWRALSSRRLTASEAPTEGTPSYASLPSLPAFHLSNISLGYLVKSIFVLTMILISTSLEDLMIYY